MWKVTVEKKKCDGCESCVDICPFEVFEMQDDNTSEPVNMDECEGCMSCVESCPQEAITVEEV